MLGKLYIVATPIGNLSDISQRALVILRNVSLVLTEDTRVTNKLLKHFDIETHTLLFNHYSGKDQHKLETVMAKLLAGEDIALVTDAGTPGISDPGNELIDYVYANSGSDPTIPIPGASALTTALSICGFNVQSFTFLGFLPKKKLDKLLREITDNKRAFVYFDSPHRVIKNLKKLEEVLGTDRRVFVARELTKAHETHYRGTIDEVISALSLGPVKGEIVVVVEGE